MTGKVIQDYLVLLNKTNYVYESSKFMFKPMYLHLRMIRNVY